MKTDYFAREHIQARVNMTIWQAGVHPAPLESAPMQPLGVDVGGVPRFLVSVLTLGVTLGTYACWQSLRSPSDIDRSHCLSFFYDKDAVIFEATDLQSKFWYWRVVRVAYFGWGLVMFSAHITAKWSSRSHGLSSTTIMKVRISREPPPLGYNSSVWPRLCVLLDIITLS